MSNPYQSPSYDPKPFQDAAANGGAVPSGFGWVNQVRIVAILNAVQGGLEAAIGLVLTAVGGVIS